MLKKKKGGECGREKGAKERKNNPNETRYVYGLYKAHSFCGVVLVRRYPLNWMTIIIHLRQIEATPLNPSDGI